MNDKEIRLGGLVKESVVDGVGIRFALFGSGCKHACYNCQNESLWDLNYGTIYKVDDLVQQIIENPYIDGITCSGGDPFEQPEAFAALCNEVKNKGLNVWTYTGYTFEHILNNIDKKPGWRDLVYNTDILVDGPFIDNEKDLSLAYRGSKNQRIIDVKQSLSSDKIVILDLDNKK